jgi:hypothetical protein
MADDVNQQVEDALNKIVKLTNESGNLKELRNSIHEKVSELRNLIYIIKDNLNEKISENDLLQNEVKDLKKSLEAQRTTQAEGQLATPMCNTQEPRRTGSRTDTPPSEGRKKQYAEVLAGKKGTSHKLTVRAKENESTEAVKSIIKANIDPTHMKIGIRTFKGLQNGKVLIEADTEEEIAALQDQIRHKCRDKLETRVQKRRKPRMIIYNVPDEITMDNAADIICEQNPELPLKTGDITTKFITKNKRNARNLVIEVDTQTYRVMKQNKLKMGWTICRLEDYIAVTRCFKCSRFNHYARDCRSEETCPVCAGNHKMKDCKAMRTEHRCINCTTYNKFNQNKKVSEAHTTLDRECPSMQAMLEKYRQNIAY